MVLIVHLHLLCKAYYAFYIPIRGLIFAILRLRNLTLLEGGKLVIPIISEKLWSGRKDALVAVYCLYNSDVGPYNCAVVIG